VLESQKIFALVTCCFVFLYTLNLVRRRRLREEYSVLWLATSLLMFILVIRYEWLVALTGLIGAGLPTTTLFIGAIIFLMLITVQFSIKLSRLTDQVKNLAQENALLRTEAAQHPGAPDAKG
jgi:hypothetical protein